MADPLRKMMIGCLMADKFPTKGAVGKALKNHLVSGVEQFAEASALRAELDALDDESLKSRYDAVAVPKAKAAEDARPFNQPFAKADFGHWAKLAYWKVDEGIALLLGRSPQFLVWESVKDVPSPLVWQFGRIREVAVRAVHYKQLNDPGYPGAFVTWAKRLASREGDSLRKLVIGMAIKGYSLDPSAGRSKVVAEIVSDLLELGLELSDDTVRRHLKEAAELLPPPSAPERQRDK